MKNSRKLSIQLLTTAAIAIAIITAACGNLHAQTKFQKAYGDTRQQSWGYCVQQTSDGGYIIAGSNIDRQYDAVLVKTNASGTIMWTSNYTRNHVFADDMMEEARYVIEVDNYPFNGVPDGYVFVGWRAVYEGIPNIPKRNLLAVKTDLLGNVIWMREYGEATNQYDEVGYCVRQNPTNGNYVITGFAEINVGGNVGPQVILLELNQNTGALVWDRAYGQAHHPEAGVKSASGYSLEEFDSDLNGSPDGWIIAGWHTHNPYPTTLCGDEVYVIATTWTGTPRFLRRIGSTCGLTPSTISYEKAYSVQQSSNGNIILAGSFQPPAGISPGLDAMLIELRFDGNVINWMRRYGGFNADAAHSVRETQNGDIVGGESDSYTMGGVGPLGWMFHTNANGSTINWSRTYGDPYSPSTYGHSVRQTSDQGYVLAGWTDEFGPGYKNLFLVKTDGVGQSGCYNDIVSPDVDDLSRYLHPFGDEISINRTSTVMDDDQYPNLTEGIRCFSPKPSLPPAGSEIDLGRVGTAGALTAVPNPVHAGDKATVIVEFPEESPARLIVTNLLGEVIFTRDDDYAEGEHRITVNTTDWTAGTYTITIEADGKVKTGKMIVVE